MLRPRADRLATLYVFHPLQSLRRAAAAAVPILMYHRVAEVAEDRPHPYYQTVTTPRVFADHMEFLRQGQYRAITLADAVSLTQSAGRRQEKAVAITFDDG